MTIHLIPDDSVPFDDDEAKTKPNDTDSFLKNTTAAANTARLLGENGADMTVTKEDQDTAAQITASFASNPELTIKKVTPKRLAMLRPATLDLTDKVLQNYAHSVVENSKQLRHLVTNKLIQETENPDPRIRLRALELLGKISDVGLFAEKTEITVTHQTTDDIRDRLKHKLMKLVMPQDNTEYAVVLDAKAVNLTDEIGLPGDSDD